MSAATGSQRPAEGVLPGEDDILPRAGSENFPVALRWLVGRRTSDHLLALYGFARLVDQLGDEHGDTPGADRLAALDRVDRDLDRIYGGLEPEHPVMRRLAVTVRARTIPRGPFDRLVAANRRDQERVDYASYDELAGYCDLSANPVGELVLYLFEAATPERIALSDRVCTGLQLLEHWQDVGEDFGRGRIYLPADDRSRFGVAAADLGAAATSPALRELMAFEVTRARELLDAGAPLVGTLRGRARIAVAGFVGGGRAHLDQLTAMGHDVLAERQQLPMKAMAPSIFRTWRRGR